MNTELAKRFRLLASVLSVLAVLAIIAIGWIYTRVRASLPQLDGTIAVPAMSANVTVERDHLGVPTIQAANRIDAARALGFLHAQERFFQMDVWRRVAAGELSAVFGPKTLRSDRAMRMHGFRKLAQATVAQLPPEHRAILEAYCEGVNAGLSSLHEKPFEYLVVRTTPEPWKPEDTFLVSDAMLTDLQDDRGIYGQTLMTLRDVLGAPALALFAPVGTPADAALDGSTAPVAPIPGPEVINLRAPVASGVDKSTAVNQAAEPVAVLPTRANAQTHARVDALFFAPETRDSDFAPGSNAFALAGTHTANGAALLASDIHLTLRVPNVWYRVSMQLPGHTVTGITLPGTPLIIAGSNGRVAWSFTNGYVDTGDLVTLDVNPVAPSLYRVPGRNDLVEIEHRREVISVHGDKPDTAEYDWTIWGPIVGHGDHDRLLAYLWTGHDPAASNLELLRMEDAPDARSAVDIAHTVGMPAQNIVIADNAGNIAWTIAGRLPRRVGYDGRLPVTFQFADRRWDGYVPPDEIPVVTTTPDTRPNESRSETGRIWSANQRMIGGRGLEILGDGAYGRPNRAAQIRDDIAGIERATPRDLLAVQLDDRAVFLEPWHKLLLDTLSPQVTGEKPIRAALRGYVEKWEGHASVDSVSYPIVRLFRTAVFTRTFSPIFQACKEANPKFNSGQLMLEGAMWKLLQEKPEHLLEPKYASWDALLVAAVDDVISELDRTGVRLPYATWGLRNRAEIRHPFSYTLPWFFRSMLDMPPDQLPGDNDMPRVQAPTHGASERFVVSPGHENEGIFEMPCGQSGHPLSPYYRAGHDAWVKGAPTPFLPGPSEHTLVLATVSGATGK